ncbi:hypothetical protein INR49_008530 [Caranx melampygus]|nr:hypothetical protein INR49_008530 [Caranx melampygus]
MDVYLGKKMKQNSINYKRSLDRIIDKYSKLHHGDGGITVDVDKIKPRTLQRYMRQSRMELSKLESKLDFMQQDGMADETSVSFKQFSGEGSGMSRGDTTQLTVSSLNESWTNVSETELQPEDQDKDLEMTLSSHGSFVELYPSMISRIEKAWHRQNVSEAADSVMRRYRRWRRHSSRSSLNSTFIVTQTHTSSHPKI